MTQHFDLDPTYAMAGCVETAILAAGDQPAAVSRGLIEGLFRGLRAAGVRRADATEMILFYAIDLPLSRLPGFLHTAIGAIPPYNAAAGRWYPPCVLATSTNQP